MKIIKRTLLDNSEVPEYRVMGCDPQNREEVINAVREDIIDMYTDEDEERLRTLDELFGPDFDYSYREIENKGIILFDDMMNGDSYEYFVIG